MGYLFVGSWGWGFVYRLDRISILVQSTLNQLDPSVCSDVSICGAGGIPDRHGENRVSICDYLQRTTLWSLRLALFPDYSVSTQNLANQTSCDIGFRVRHGSCDLRPLPGTGLNGKLYWLRTAPRGSWIYGPYINHNHYAGLMEMLVPFPLVFSLTTYARGGLRKAAVLASAVMATTIFLSGSRGGMVAFICELIFLVCVLIWQRSSGRNSFSSKLTLALFAVFFLSFLGWVGGHEAIDRLLNVGSTRHEITSGLRLAIDRDLLKMFPHRPILGWGLGNFEYVYPQFRSFYTSYHIDEAHNDYLQLLIDVGAAGFITMLWFLWLVFRIGSKKLRNWPTDINGAIALAALLGVTGILVHSLVDFNLQVPANAAMFYVLCTIAAMEPRFDSFRPPRRD